MLPTLWFRNTWSWKDGSPKPRLQIDRSHAIPGVETILIEHETLGEHRLYLEGASELLFTENETNYERVFHSASPSPYVKDAINDYVVEGKHDAVNPRHVGTKMAGLYRLDLAPGETKTIRARLCQQAHPRPFGDFDATFRSVSPRPTPSTAS